MNFIKLHFNQQPFLLDPTHIMTVASLGYATPSSNMPSSITLDNGVVFHADETVDDISNILDSVEGITSGGNAKTVK